MGGEDGEEEGACPAAHRRRRLYLVLLLFLMGIYDLVISSYFLLPAIILLYGRFARSCSGATRTTRTSLLYVRSSGGEGSYRFVVQIRVRCKIFLFLRSLSFYCYFRHVYKLRLLLFPFVRRIVRFSFVSSDFESDVNPHVCTRLFRVFVRYEKIDRGDGIRLKIYIEPFYIVQSTRFYARCSMT